MIDLDCDMSVEPRSEELRKAREEKETNIKLKKTTNLWFGSYWNLSGLG